jgi:hypothetical protein
MAADALFFYATVIVCCSIPQSDVSMHLRCPIQDHSVAVMGTSRSALQHALISGQTIGSRLLRAMCQPASQVRLLSRKCFPMKFMS